MTANAVTASAAWPWQVAGETLKWMTDARPAKSVIPLAVGVTAAQLPAKKHGISPGGNNNFSFT